MIQVDTEMQRVFGQLYEVQKRLLNGALLPANVRRPLQDIIEGKVPVSPQLPSWYVSPEQQLANTRRWNQERGWGFAEGDFPAGVPAFTPSSPLEVLVLAVYLPDDGKGRKAEPGYARTANELWALAGEAQPSHWQWDSLRLDAGHLRLLPEVDYRPGIRWVGLDLGAHWGGRGGVRPRDVRGANLAHAEVLAAAAHFPKWVQSMNGEKVPFVWLAGYQVTVPGDEAWTNVPILSWGMGNREVYLYAHRDGYRYSYYAIPAVRELK